MIYQSTDTWLTSRETCFVCFVQHGVVLKMFVRLFWIKASEILKKVQQELFARKKNGEMGTKRALDYVRMPKLQEIFTTAAIVFHRYERLAVLQMFSPSFCFEQEKTLKNFSKKLYAIKIKKKRRSRDKK